MKNVIVYSKENCPSCVKAKNMLNQMEIQFKEYIVGVNATREELLDVIPTARSVPQILIDGKVIGGYDQLVEYIENNSFNGTGWTL
jgi:glutaredoxin 3